MDARSRSAAGLTAVAALGCLASFAGFWLAQRAAYVSMIDLMVYRAEGWAARHGGGLYGTRSGYGGLPATYPPFAALVFVPLTWVGTGVMRTAATAANLALVVALSALSLRLVGRPIRVPRAAAVLGVAAVAVWCEPVWGTLRYGQVNLLLAVLVLWDLTRGPGHRWAGAGIGFAAGMKLTPGLFVAFLAAAGLALAWRGRRTPYLRRALVATGTFTATVAVAAAALPRDSRRYWTAMVLAPDRAGYGEETANQSLRGVVARVEHTGHPGAAWLLVAAVVAGAGLAVAVAALLAGDRLPQARAWAVVACAMTALLVSPVSWSHHWVWAVPIVLLQGSEALRRRDRRWAAATALAALLFCSYALWLVPHGEGRPELRQTAGQILLSASYPLAGLAFLGVAGTLAVRALSAGPGSGALSATVAVGAPDQP